MLPVIDANSDKNTKHLEAMKGLVSGLLFKIGTNTSETKNHLAAIKLQTKGILAKMTDAQNVEADKVEDVEAERVDEATGQDTKDAVKEESAAAEERGENVQGQVFNEQVLVKIPATLKEIEKHTKDTADAVKILSGAAKEDAENVGGDQTSLTDDSGDPKSVVDTVVDDTKEKMKNLKGKFFAVLLGGLVGGIGGIVGGFLKAFRLVFSNLLIKPLRGIFPKTIGRISNAFTKIGTQIQKFFKFIAKPFQMVGNVIGTLVKGGGKVAGIFSRIGSFFGTFVKVAGKVAGVVSKIFFPLTVLFASFEAIKGAIEGFVNTDGSMLDKIIGGLMGAVNGLFDFFVRMPLDLITGLIDWIAGIMGFDGVREKLESMAQGFINMFQNIGIPSFTIPMPDIFGGDRTFPGFFPFKPDPEPDSGGEGGEPESPVVKVSEMDETPVNIGELKEIKLPGIGSALVGETEDGGFTFTNTDGQTGYVAPGSDLHAVMKESLAGEASMIDTSASDGGGVEGATTDALAATEEAMVGPPAGGDNIIIGGSSASSSSSSTYNTYGTKGTHSLETRQKQGYKGDL